jgi:Thymidine kinase
MGSGKSEALITMVKKIGRQNSIVVCPPPLIDTRNKGKVCSRSKKNLEPDSYGIDSFAGQQTKGKVLFVDEYHLFPAVSLGGCELNKTCGIQSAYFNDEQNFLHVHVFVINQVIDGYSHLKRLITNHQPYIKYYGCTKSKNHHIRRLNIGDNSIMAGGDEMYTTTSEDVWLAQYLKGVLIND